MSKSARGCIDEPGRNVAQKSGLNRSIFDQGWGEFCRQLKHKQEWRGGMMAFVDSKHTSQTCPICSHLAQGNRLTQETFRCLECFFEDNADKVAVQNILSRSLGFLN